MVNKGQWWSIMLDRIIYDYIEQYDYISPKVTMLIMVVNNGEKYGFYVIIKCGLQKVI